MAEQTATMQALALVAGMENLLDELRSCSMSSRAQVTVAQLREHVEDLGNALRDALPKVETAGERGGTQCPACGVELLTERIGTTEHFRLTALAAPAGAGTTEDMRVPQDGVSGLAAIVGRWPGDESDEEVAVALGAAPTALPTTTERERQAIAEYADLVVANIEGYIPYAVHPIRANGCDLRYALSRAKQIRDYLRAAPPTTTGDSAPLVRAGNCEGGEPHEWSWLSGEGEADMRCISCGVEAVVALRESAESAKEPGSSRGHPLSQEG